MQDYWQRKMKRVWKLDKKIAESYAYERFGLTAEKVNFVNQQCALQRDACGEPLAFGNNHCYPRTINEYLTREELLAKINGNSYKIYEHLVDETLQGQLYRPDTDLPIYRPEFYNHNTNFSIIVRDGDRTSWYDYDCCYLFSFSEIEEVHWKLNYFKKNKKE